jgi:hypothetical protein
VDYGIGFGRNLVANTANRQQIAALFRVNFREAKPGQETVRNITWV